ncbi:MULTISPECIES: Mrp/NBP35 family ATP-binding protein [Tenacibaculum]|uniref:Iron-sulfur cluster carrier protein n=2 Tax=Tenacibaculum TaxID=104267 RepID=A0AAE9SGS4_9FLAO|nr:Mrp/NBP35 family ATP-binding protein [Tenacibaculum mesophilum]GFD71692.1 iron-sulfur cluster carrier protein [Tenacibaculum sp. KUL113]GFD78618.1 iron-sulfur cluster carrier protein [Tenacibaculum sp. KUL118]GFD99208.1 iron-sulfur cluster carrier protein [Alteromonas sp. KUL156]AZJ33130.1 MRP family ATP-binding protein [Tenacibaculum mesophilum]KAF9659374.1 Mrp/NBP35 family ATP-binding protein [Tenacibaculum mesophilum]|eukprot:TRINITY_DN5095_c0_g1_i1.p1 TRINITY_DN5095_c0_g1~~TRINITY_DN5095_c0_g1_i1.p1  ORF type:complete len:377 (-),score=83.15 TRINITY_DN5095_c0_g1_i1:372-1502(-)
MSFKKQDIYKALETITAPGEGKSLVENENITNVVTFGDEVIVDVTISNPSLQAKKKVEVEIMKAIHQHVDQKIDVKVNVKVEVQQKENPNQIRGKEIPNIQNIIAIASGKGGVGKSTITSNMAVSLAKMGFKVGVLDADVYGPSQHLMFDVEREKPLAVNVNGRSKMKPIESYGVKLLSLGFFTDPSQAVIWRGPMASKALNQLIFDADWGELDFLLIDLPPGTGDVHLSIVQAVPINGAVVVSTPQNIALADAKKGVAMFKQESINVPVLGIVENMAYFTPAELPNNKYYIFGEGGAKNLAEDIETSFLGEIPLVQSIREAGDVGHPVALQENTPLAEAFTEVTKEMVSQLLKRNANLPPTEVVRITTMSGCSSK